MRWLVAAVVLVPSLAAAQPPPIDPGGYADAEETMAISGSARSMSSQWLIMPPGTEATGELRFLTGQHLSLTDVVVASAGLRHGFGGKAELAGGIDLLPKQPSDTDENVFQAANLGVQYAIGKKGAAAVGVAGGPVSGRDGLWTTTSVSLQRRSIVHDTLSFQLGLGGDLTNLRFDDDSAATLGEVTASLRTVFQIQDAFGLWFAGSFAFPVAHGGTLMGGADFDPQTRVDVAVGTVYSLVDDWDVYMQMAVVDRGDAENPATTLPILQGGSDQRVFSFGITRHFGDKASDGGDYDYLAAE